MDILWNTISTYLGIGTIIGIWYCYFQGMYGEKYEGHWRELIFKDFLVVMFISPILIPIVLIIKLINKLSGKDANKRRYYDED